MAKQNTVKKGFNSNLRSNNVTGRKKTLAISMLVFAVVGVVFLIRSFAASVVIQFNPGSNVGTTNIPSFTSNSATKVTESVTDGKKVNNVEYAELKGEDPSQDYGQGAISYPQGGVYYQYKTRLNAGYYDACATVKLTYAKTTGNISVTKDPNGSASVWQQFGETTAEAYYTASPYGINMAIGTEKEVCTTFKVESSETTKDMYIRLNAYHGIIRSRNFAIKLSSRQEITASGLIKAATLVSEGYTFGVEPDYIHFNNSDPRNNYGLTVVNDVDAAGSSIKAVEMYRPDNTGVTLRINRYITPALAGKQLSLCATFKAINPTPSSKLFYYINNGRDNGGSPEYIATADDANYRTKCTAPSTTVVDRSFIGTFQVNGGKWRITDVYFQGVN